MEIVGSGFIARNLEPIAKEHKDAVLLAAGVSSTSCRDEGAFAREAELLYRTIRMCQADRRRLVFFSTASSSLYGGDGVIGREEGSVFPQTAYGRHKLALERVVAQSGVDFLTLRISTLVGPYQPRHQLLPGLLNQIRSGTVRVFRGAQRDLLDVEHLVTAVDALLARGFVRTVVNIASGFPTPAESIVRHLERALGSAAAWSVVSRTECSRVSTKRMLALVPEAAEFGFGADYARRILDRYLPSYLSS